MILAGQKGGEEEAAEGFGWWREGGLKSIDQSEATQIGFGPAGLDLYHAPWRSKGKRI